MKSASPIFRKVLRLSAGIAACIRLSAPGLSGQTIEAVGSASSIANARVPVINDAGNVFYVNGGSFVIGNPITPVQRSFLSVITMQTPGGGDPVPYVLSSNGTVTYITSTTLFQSNINQRLNVAQGGAQAAGFGDPLIKYALRSVPTSVSGVFDYGVAPDDTMAFRAEVSSNNFFNQHFGIYVGLAANLTLVMDSFHEPPGLSGYAVNNNGYVHASRNLRGLSVFIAGAYNNSLGDSGNGIWLHDAAGGIRLAVWASPYTGFPLPGEPAAKVASLEFGINYWPALDDDGRFAFVARGSLFPRNLYGVYAGFENNLQPVATDGLGVPGDPGVYFTNFAGAGPIRMGTGGKMVFIGTIAGAGITFAVNDKVLVFGSNPADLKILAQAGTQAPGMPAGVVWKWLIIDDSGRMENPVSYPLNDQVVMFGNNRVAFVGQVTGPGIAAGPSASANDSGIWVTDDNGNLTLLARRGSPMTTTTVTVTPTNYFALQGGSGRDGKPSGGNRAGQLAFANGATTYRATYAQPAPLQLSNPVFIGGQLQLTFATENNGKTYRVQSNPDVTNANSWTDAQTFVGDGSTKTFLAMPAAQQGYYRIGRDP